MKKNLNKWASGLLILTLSLSLSGCGSETPGQEESTSTQAVTEVSSSEGSTEGEGAKAESGSYTYADTISWDGRYDVVVVGFGGAGAVAAKTAAEEGANVLIVEKAPEGHEGGNTRYCGQMFVYGNGNYEATLDYYQALNGTHEVDEAILSVYCQGIANLADTLAEMYDLDKSNFLDVKANPNVASQSPEYPELPGSDSISLMSSNGQLSDGYLWGLMRQAIVDNPEKVDVWFESPAVHLIQEPQTGTIIGVQVEREGQILNVRADNGVVLACGGFENNDEMCETYLGMTDHGVIGTLYNTGDGITMAMEVGAQLWHMHVYEGIASLGASSIIPEEGERGMMIVNPALFSGSAMVISGAGTRFLNESEGTRHGHVKNGDVYENPQWPQQYYLLLDEAQYQAALARDSQLGPNSFLQEYKYVTTAASLDELAGLLDMDAETLKTTVDNFNTFIEDGADLTTGRDVATMSHFQTDGNVYAVELIPNILNTQGGPKRNENAEIIGLDGEPIPHLYSAGELGGISALQYQGGGNMAECLIFGQIAGRNAAAAKEQLPAYTVGAVESPYTYTVGVMNDLTKEKAQIELGENQYYGEGNGMGGTLGVVVTMDGDTIVSVEVVSHSETEGIGTKAIEQLPPAIVDAQSTDVDAIASATITSRAICEAVEAALASR